MYPTFPTTQDANQPQPPPARPTPGEVPEPRPGEDESRQRDEAIAENLRKKTGGGYLYASMGFAHKRLPPTAYVPYMEKTLRDAGNPQDPVEAMMIEQVTIAHHNVGRLLMAAAAAETIEQAKLYNDAATKLLGEFRRLALAIKEYREPTAARQFTLIRQQNVAREQQIAMVDGRDAEQGVGGAAPADEKTKVDSKIGSKNALEYQPIEQLVPEESASRGGRQEEPVEAARPDARRPRGVAAGRACEQALGASDGPADIGGEGPLRTEWQVAAGGGQIGA